VGPSRQSAAIVIRQMQATIPKLSTQESMFFDEVRVPRANVLPMSFLNRTGLL